MLASSLTAIRQDRIILPWILFLLLGQLVFTLPEIMLLIMVGIGVVLFKRSAFRLSLVSSENRDLMLISVCFSSIFFLKLASSLWAVHPESAVSNAFNHVHFLMWPFVLVYFRRARVQFSDAVLPLTAGLCVAAIWGGHRFWFKHDVCFSAGVHNCGLLIQTLGVSIIFLTWMLVVASPTMTRIKHVAALGLIAALFTLWVTQRRTEWIVLAFTLPLLLLAKPSWLRKHYKSVCAAILLILVAGLVVLSQHPRFKDIYPQATAYMSGAQSNEELIRDSSVGIRLEQYRIATSAISDRPLLGWGAGVKPRHLMSYARDNSAIIPYSHFHNQYLQTLLETGAFGLLVAFLAVAYLFNKLVVKAYFSAARPYAVLLGALFIYHALRGMANHSFGYSPINTFFVVWTAAIVACIIPIRTPENTVT
jgi:O-antigen ligase